MLFNLTVSRFAWTNSFPDGLNFGVDIRLNVDLFAFLTVRDVEDRTAATHVVRHGAEQSATFTRAYGIASSRDLASYSVEPCRWKL